MASSLKNISALLSPTVLSPLTPTRKLLLLTPRSEGRLFLQQIKGTKVAKKLDFSGSSKQLSTFARPTSATNVLPDIKIEIAPEDIHRDLENFEHKHFLTKSPHTLDINTPNKSELAKNGLSNFKNCTWVLGKGTFGTVFKGKQKGKLVAVKIVSKEDSCRERNALNLIHRNIIRTLEIIKDLEHQKYSLIVMEYIENCKNLQEILDNLQTNEALSTDDHTKWLKNCCLDITAGLDFCHKNGVLHLDLKPKNILVNSKNVCQICDFGNSVKIGDNLDSFKHNGTVVYTAPEILFGKMPSKKSDIYSLGLIFWQLKYQKTPFQGYDSNETIIYNVGKYNIRPPYKEESTDRLINIFTKCWASDPNLRPDTKDVLKELEFVSF